MKIGQKCIASCGAPAIYIGFGKCVWVSAMCNDTEISNVSRRKCQDKDYILPDEAEVQGAIETVKKNKNYNGYLW